MQATAVPRAGQEAMLAWLAAAAGDNSIRVTGGEVIPLLCLWIRLHVCTEASMPHPDVAFLRPLVVHQRDVCLPRKRSMPSLP